VWGAFSAGRRMSRDNLLRFAQRRSGIASSNCRGGRKKQSDQGLKRGGLTSPRRSICAGSTPTRQSPCENIEVSGFQPVYGARRGFELSHYIIVLVAQILNHLFFIPTNIPTIFFTCSGTTGLLLFSSRPWFGSPRRREATRNADGSSPLRLCQFGGGGDAANAILAAAGYNFRRLLKWLALLCAFLLGVFCLAERSENCPTVAGDAFFTDDG
jgi:hypothetical protein